MIVERIRNTTRSYTEIPVEQLARERKKTLTAFAVDPESQSQDKNRPDSEQKEEQEAKQQLECPESQGIAQDEESRGKQGLLSSLNVVA